LVSQTAKPPLESTTLGLGVSDPGPIEPPIISGGYQVEIIEFEQVMDTPNPNKTGTK